LRVKMLRIPRPIFNEMFLHAREESPLEACGYLGGKGGIITKLFRMRNVDASEKHFSFEPEEQLATAKKARQEDLDLIAVYHSHPHSQPRPSKEDILLAYDPDLIYVILSLLPPKPIAKAFRIEEGKTVEILLRIM
jgi:proteasome lid subunit RPN8/RPN11